MPYRKQKKLIRTHYLELEEAGALCSAPDRRYLLGIRDFAIIKTFLNTGLRRQELIDLRVGDLKQGERGWYLSIHSKGGTVDDQPIESDETISAIRKYLEMNGHNSRPTEPLFQPLENYTKTKEKKINRKSLENMLKKYTKKADIYKKITPHTLRHTFGTAVYNATKDIVVVQKLMRHRSISSTAIYMHTDDSQARRGLSRANF